MPPPVNDQKQWALVVMAQSISRPVGTACALLGLLALAGYLGNIEGLYRPIANGSATNPLTALCVLLLGLGVRSHGKARTGIGPGSLFALLAIMVVVARLGEVLIGTDLTSLITPFHHQVMADLQKGKSNSMGINTAVMLLSIAVALLLSHLKMPKASQVMASIAIAIPTISVTGYVYGLEEFYGQMSIISTAVGLGLACAALALTADHGGLKSILSPYIEGKIARTEVLAGYLVPTVLGYFLIKSTTLNAAQYQNLFGIYVVTICWFIIMMAGISAAFVEQVNFERRENEAKLVEASQTDALTGLLNRRAFFEFGLREIERIKRTGNELWVLMLDIDHFKNINDTAGHAMGDRVLVAISNLLSRTVRKVDVVGRLGGEEFAILVTDTNQSGSQHVAESIRQNVESLSVPGWTDIYGAITASIGAAKLSHIDTLDEALKMADGALYRAKKNGRNQVAFSNPADDQTESSPHKK